MIDLAAEYPSQTVADPAYPTGKARNITTPGDGLGTPWEAALVNDFNGMMQAVVKAASITPSGNPETADVSDILDGLRSIMYPVGSIYTNAAVATNPGTLIGFGTWTLFGEGKVMVGIDTGDTDFDTIGETGGEKEHVLTEAELASHNHGTFYATGGGTGLPFGSDVFVDPAATATTGNDEAHNNVQPYVVVYMWQRTA